MKKQRNTLLKIHPNRRWAAFVAGLILVLMTELGVHFEDSISMLVSSAVPEGKAVSSSASVEFASMAAIAAARGLNICPRDLALLCQKVENHIVGAPCGVRDQMTSACGKANKLLAMVCQHWWCRLWIRQSWYLYGLKDDKVYCFFDLVSVIT